jgi:hypothetical protein
MTYIDDCTRVYGRHGVFAHLLAPGHRTEDDAALCGRMLWASKTYAGTWNPWLGTGSQAEYERAASLPLCSMCEHRAKGQR